jgi:hypothetical protein
MKYIRLFENYSQYDAMLIGGLDYRAGDYKIDKQVELLKKTYGTNKNVMGFRYNTPTSTILEFLAKNPKIDVYMFSAGCSKAEEIAKSPNLDLNRVFIIEPYAVSARTKRVVQSAVSLGVPAKNVIVGPNAARGKGVVEGATDSGGVSHWGALKKYESDQRSAVPAITAASGSNIRIVKGEFFPPKGDYDAMHSFQSRKRDGFGGKMNTLVNAELEKFYAELKLNPEIKEIKITMDDVNWKVSWEVKIGESRDGKAWMGLTSRGGAGRKEGSSGSVARAESQAVRKITNLPAEVGDPGLESKRVYDLNFQGKGAYVRQIFIAYTNPAKFPHLPKKTSTPQYLS